MAKKRRMPAHIVLPNGMWRFVKKGRRVSTRRRRVIAAPRYKRRRTVTMARYRRSRGRRGGGGGRGKLGMFAPVIAGVADAVINPRSPINGIGSVVVGFGLKNQFCKDVGLYQVGQSVATFIPFIGASAGGGVTSQV